jgi:hypothetical protein
MHIPKQAFFRNWGAFQFLARHHFMHHEQVDKNFNVVFPLADFVLGSVARPTLGNVREMMRLGYLAPRRPLSAAQLERRRRDIAAHRETVLREHQHVH